MARDHVGRHRAPGYNPLNEIADIATRSAQPAMKVSAVAVASGGLVATFAMPASAAPSNTEASAVAGGQAVATAPQIASQTVAVAAPPAAAEVAVQPSVGVLGFTAQAVPAADTAPLSITKIAPPAPAPAPAPTAAPAATTTTRAARTTTTARTAPAAPAAAAAPAAPAAAAPAAPSANGGGIIANAIRLSGIPYVYGGMSTSGADCSGYVGLVFRAATGQTLPRTAEAQRQAATKVSNPQPGDLVFFGYPAYHVGIFAGGGMLYDAERPGTVSGLHSIWTYNNVSYGRF